MKNVFRKCVVVLLALAIALGSVTLLGGCKKKESTTTPVQEPNKKTAEKPAK